jgi:hypothetical protein
VSRGRRRGVNRRFGRNLRRVAMFVVVGLAGLLTAVAAAGRTSDLASGHGPPTWVPGPPPWHRPSTSSVTTTTTVSTTTTVQTTTTATTSTVSSPPPAAPPSSGGPGTPLADVSVAAAQPAESVFAGQSITVASTVTNAGPSTATGVFVAVQADGSRLLASAATAGSCWLSPSVAQCTLGTLVPGASAVVMLTLTPMVATGSMAATLRVGADQPDPRPTNNVTRFQTVVLAGHPGPPDLATSWGSSALPLVAHRSGAAWVVETTVHVDEASTIVVSVVGSSGRILTMLPGTRIDYLPVLRPHVSVEHEVGAAGWVPLHVRIGGPAGRSYRIVVEATGPDGSSASTNMRFRT